MDRAGYVRLDAEYLLHVRPHLTDREARVYEAVVLVCDGWDRPTTTAVIASITRLHIDHVRKAMRVLEQLALIVSNWLGAPTSPNGQRSVTIARDYAATLHALQALGRISPEQVEGVTQESTKALGQISPEPSSTLGQIGPKTLGRNSPETLGQIGRGHLISRSDPDPSIPPSPPSHAADVPEAAAGQGELGREGGTEATDVPAELVELCRGLWGAEEVPLKAARRYLARLLPVGAPVATPSEISRYLRAVAKSHRVQTARCPIAVACMPDEFGSWLDRRRAEQTPKRQARASPEPSDALSREEIGRRAAAFASRLARCPVRPEPANRAEVV